MLAVSKELYSQTIYINFYLEINCNLENTHMVNKLSLLDQMSLNYKLVKFFYNQR